MLWRLSRWSLRHRGAITVALVGALLLNLVVIGGMSKPDPSSLDDLPSVARCQGGGPGCAEQPLIPPPSGGLPRFDAPANPVFGALVLIAPAPPSSVDDAPPSSIEHPPALTVA